MAIVAVYPKFQSLVKKKKKLREFDIQARYKVSINY